TGELETTMEGKDLEGEFKYVNLQFRTNTGKLVTANVFSEVKGLINVENLLPESARVTINNKNIKENIPTTISNKLFDATKKELKKGAVVQYLSNTYLFWNQNNAGKAQLIKTDGTKFSGTPNIDKLTVLGAYPTVMYNNTEYIVTDNNNVYSGATGSLVYTGSDNSSRVQKERIINLAKPTAKEDISSSFAKTYSGLITKLEDNQIFVFGSNPVGINGNPSKGTGGAALVATNNNWVKQNEKMDNRLSDSGKAWGLTTVSYPGKRRSKTPEEIKDGIKKLYDYAIKNPRNEFLVAYTGTGTNLNGYSNKELADMFSSFTIPNNIVFEEQFATLLNTTTKPKQLNLFEDFKDNFDTICPET
ncbi:MAG TPA: hypothetical protein PLG47_06225, partial [Candidatus Dojkabacteria bacterium]|nr:hypothetical protein [Candidatus Dojkabacteria bacterium]